MTAKQTCQFISRQTVKEAADYVTAGNDENGLVQVIRKFILE